MSDATVTVTKHDHDIRIVEFSRPPHNYFDENMIGAIADALEAIDADVEARASVLCSAGKNFCAGADFSSSTLPDPLATRESGLRLYAQAVRLFRLRKPFVAAVQGAAVGGGLGLALTADFRIASPESRFCANFSRLGLHQGFGISESLPWTVGRQHASELLLTGRRIDGERAHRIGLADRCVASPDIRVEALQLAREIADAAPLAVISIRRTDRKSVV